MRKEWTFKVQGDSAHEAAEMLQFASEYAKAFPAMFNNAEPGVEIEIAEGISVCRTDEADSTPDLPSVIW